MHNYLPKNLHYYKIFACIHSLYQADMQSRNLTYIKIYKFTQLLNNQMNAHEKYNI